MYRLYRVLCGSDGGLDGGTPVRVIRGHFLVAGMIVGSIAVGTGAIALHLTAAAPSHILAETIILVCIVPPIFGLAFAWAVPFATTRTSMTHAESSTQSASPRMPVRCLCVKERPWPYPSRSRPDRKPGTSRTSRAPMYHSSGFNAGEWIDRAKGPDQLRR